MIEVPLTRGQVALVDDDDAWVLRHRWHALRRSDGRGFYAARNLPRPARGTVYLHRVLMEAPAGVEVDHVSGDGLDCRKANLRLATHRDNAANTQRVVVARSGFKGVRQTAAGRWRAYIKNHGRQLHLGHFDSPEEAARAYDEAAVRLFGQFARPNFAEAAS